jgi:hypothetical protein
LFRGIAWEILVVRLHYAVTAAIVEKKDNVLDKPVVNVDSRTAIMENAIAASAGHV